MVDREISLDAARLSVVAAGDGRTAEIVVDQTVQCAELTTALWSLEDQGWRATVVVPTARLGEAHTALRGVPCRLQGWWEDSTGICFGSHELP